MALFLSTYVNRVDRKGRVSVPAAFRATLADQSFQGVVLFSSAGHRCLEGFGMGRMEDLSARLDAFDMFSPEQDDLATSIFGDSVQLPFDGDGRVLLPQSLIDFAGLATEAAFVGLGVKFQIWNPQSYEARKTEARNAVKAKGLTLPASLSKPLMKAGAP
jgi:MraZ protein